ncbi:hypothetical protein IL306_006936, partial [Fusarium sp. DS 682]
PKQTQQISTTKEHIKMFLSLTASPKAPAETSRTRPVGDNNKSNNFLPLTAPVQVPTEISRALEELRAKVRALESEVKDLKTEVGKEIAMKEQIQISLDEANRNRHSAELELEASAKDAELGRVQKRLESINDQKDAELRLFRERLDRKDAELGRLRGRLASVNDRKDAAMRRTQEILVYAHDREAILQNEVNTLKDQNNDLVAQLRHQYSLTTHHQVQQLQPLMKGWKTQVEAKIDEKYGKNNANDNNSAAPLNENHERLLALVEGYCRMIMNLQKGNEKFELQIADLKIKPASVLSDLTIERFEAFVREREKIVTQLEKENNEVKQKFYQIEKAKAKKQMKF